MAATTGSILQTTASTLSTRAGFKLKQVRERLNLTLRQVEEVSLEIAAAERNSEHVVSVARLNQIENDGSLPSIYKLYSLAVVYKLSLDEMMSLYGINLSKMEERRLGARQTRTHLVTAAIRGSEPAHPLSRPL